MIRPFSLRRRLHTQTAYQAALPVEGEGAESLLPAASGAARPGLPALGGLLPPRPPDAPYTLTTIELVVSPFPSFREVERFHRVLNALSGAGLHAVQVRQMERGILRVRLECTDVTGLLHGLAAYYQPAFHIRARDAHRVEVVLKAPERPSASTGTR